MIDPQDFFRVPLSTSYLKYKILRYYFREYFHKVNQRYRSLAIAADLFAGKGRFDNGDAGSPIIMAEAAKVAGAIRGYKNQIVLAEVDPSVNLQLQANMKDYINEGWVRILPGNAADAGNQLLAMVPNGAPLFMLFDPFGIKGLSMDLLTRVFERARKESTEVLINFNHKALSRHLGRAVNIDSTDETKQVSALSSIEILNESMGGDWWVTISSDDSIPNELKVIRIRGAYIDKFKAIFPQVGVFHVTAGFPDEPVAYDLIFGTRSAVALELMNNSMKHSSDEMIEGIISRYNVGTLFEQSDPHDLIPQKYKTDMHELIERIHSECRALMRVDPSMSLNRPIIRRRLIPERFALHSESEYNRAFETLLRSGRLRTADGKVKLSDTTQIMLV